MDNQGHLCEGAQVSTVGVLMFSRGETGKYLTESLIRAQPCRITLLNRLGPPPSRPSDCGGLYRQVLF